MKPLQWSHGSTVSSWPVFSPTHNSPNHHCYWEYQQFQQLLTPLQVRFFFGCTNGWLWVWSRNVQDEHGIFHQIKMRWNRKGDRRREGEGHKTCILSSSLLDMAKLFRGCLAFGLLIVHRIGPAEHLHAMSTVSSPFYVTPISKVP